MMPLSSTRHGNDQRRDRARGSLRRPNGGKGMDLSVRGLAARQLADYRARTPRTFFAEEDQSRLSLDGAYAVQGEVASLRAAEGEPVVAGYEVGCTGPGVRKQFGMDGPIRGFLYRTELYRSGSKLSHAAYANLAIEGGLAVRLGDDAEIARIFPVIVLHIRGIALPRTPVNSLGSRHRFGGVVR